MTAFFSEIFLIKIRNILEFEMNSNKIRPFYENFCILSIPNY